MNAIVPIPRCSVSVRPGTMSDYAFVDRLQQMHSKNLGFLKTKALEGKIARGEVLIAEERHEGIEARRHEGVDGRDEATSEFTDPSSPSPHFVPACLRASVPSTHAFVPIGYCISSDRYMKRDDVGMIVQMNVSPGSQRKLVAGTLLRAVFERAAFGCKLFCCWCAQDLEAGYFWESMGFVPLAFRTGAVGKNKFRTHIFWQRRIREGDVTTPFWYPCKTEGGMMREDRIVLPIPPGVHWKEPMPMLIPEVQNALPAPKEKRSKPQQTPVLMPPTRRGARFGPPSLRLAPPVAVEEPKPVKPKREKMKADPALVAKARELRDRYLEQFNAGLVLPSAKYDVCRAIEEKPAAMRALPQAA